MRALAHVEGRVHPKSRHTGKKPLPLPALVAGAAGGARCPAPCRTSCSSSTTPAPRSVLLAYAQPIGRRVQTGGRCSWSACTTGSSARATPRPPAGWCSTGAGDPALAEQALRLKERDWVVVNPVGAVAPTAMVHGRLATLEGLDRDADGRLTARLALKGLSPYRRAFAYWHRRQEALRPGERYAVDEMPDDLNGDKLLAACRVAADPGGPRTPSSPGSTTRGARPGARRWPPATADGADRVGAPGPAASPPAWLRTIDAVERVNGRQGPTARQAEAIAGHLEEPVLLVQGPPAAARATHWAGPSWCAWRRSAAGATAFRVAVGRKTHNAIALVLRSVAEKLALLRRHAPYSPLAQAVREVAVYKIGGEDDAGAGTGLGDVRYLDAYAAGGSSTGSSPPPGWSSARRPAGCYSASATASSAGGRCRGTTSTWRCWTRRRR